LWKRRIEIAPILEAMTRARRAGGAQLCRAGSTAMLRPMTTALASDHAGFEYKKAIRDWLATHGHEVNDFGTSSNEPVDLS
jgi:hypothetical protein